MTEDNKNSFGLEDKLHIENTIKTTIDFLTKKYSTTDEDLRMAYKNIEKIYDYSIRTLPVKSECHGITMLYIANEYFSTLKRMIVDIHQKHPKKRYKLYINDITDDDIKAYYTAFFEECKDEEI